MLKRLVLWKQIRDYVAIVEPWQLAEVKPVLEDYIAKNISLHDCVEWLLYADAYLMEHVVLAIIKRFLNPLFMEISRSEEFRSLSLSNLISLISHKEMIHSVVVLEGCIRWIQEDESSRKHDVSALLSHIRFNGYNPAYVKRMLKTYSDSLITDQATKAHIQEMIASSFILIGAHESRPTKRRKAFSVNLASHTVTEVGTCPEQLFRSCHPRACCNIDASIFCGPERESTSPSESDCLIL